MTDEITFPPQRPPQADLAEVLDYVRRPLAKKANYYSPLTKQFVSGGLSADDLLHEAYLEAIHAASRYDIAAGKNIRDYCLQRGRGAMIDAMRRYHENYSRREKRRIVDIHVANNCKPRQHQREEDEPTSRPETPPIVDDPCDAFESTLRKFIRRILDQVDYRILTLRYVGDKTLKEIGKEFGVTEYSILKSLVRIEGEIKKHVYDQGWSEGEVAEMLLIDSRA